MATLSPICRSPSPRREWIEILVSLLQQHGPPILSPSPRREWIEILSLVFCISITTRLPPHGGSGLKSSPRSASGVIKASPSPRREWIEIPQQSAARLYMCRLPPHGGSGLKLLPALLKPFAYIRSPSPRREWIEILAPLGLPNVNMVSLPTEGVD